MDQPSSGNARRPSPAAHLGVVSTVLLAVAVLMMLWTWTEHTAFAVAAYCTVTGVFAAGFVRARAGWTELVGGPLDGARIRPARIGHRRVVVLSVPGGDLVRYGPDEAGRLVYQGPGGDR